MTTKSERRRDFNFPFDHRPHTDKYFLRSARLIREEGINPTALYQVFIRKGPGITAGIDEAIAAIMNFSPEFAEHGGKIFALRDGVNFQPQETLLTIQGPVQDLMELETIYLSILSQRTGEVNGVGDPDLEWVKETVSKICDILEKSEYGPRPLSYFGARHFGHEWDARLARAAHDGGAVSASTDIGAGTFGGVGVGTTPHALLLSFAHRYGVENYAAELMSVFNRVFGSEVPAVFLADTFNREISDSLKVARALGEDFKGPRFDTNGAVVAQGGQSFQGEKYWTGKGVTVAGVLAARRAFDEAGFPGLEIALTSGFSNPAKVAAFVAAEKKYNCQLFGFLGAGFADGRITATSDIKGFWQDDSFTELHKVGRPLRENTRLEEVDLSLYH